MRHDTSTSSHSRAARRSPLLTGAVLLTLGAAACGRDAADGQTETAASALAEANGLSPNGLSRNGLSRNGLSRNGLSLSGLSLTAFKTTDFRSWFNEDPASSNEVMAYLVKCAAPAGKSYAFKNPATGTSYTWAGLLGLAPGWASGAAPTTSEEQVITACLAAHVNKYGMHVDMSVLGSGATGLPIPVEPGELDSYATREGCFFGNVFEDEGVFVGIDHPRWDASYSSVRACAFDVLGVGPSADCPPIDNVGPCNLICRPSADGVSYASCGAFVGGAWKSYLPLTTRIKSSDVYRCGDGVCQFTESCGSGTTAGSCKSDCGLCPGTTTTTTAAKQAKQ